MLSYENHIADLDLRPVETAALLLIGRSKDISQIVLGSALGKRRLKTGLTRAAASVPVLQVDEERWEGDRLVFRVRALGQAASGHLDVAEDHARLEVTLPWLLQHFAKAAQVAIRNRGSLLLTKRS